jgi:predicted dehydrogenase
MTLRVALVGCGKVADQHVQEIQKLRTASLVSVCDREPLMAAQLAMRFGVPKRYSDFGRMLREVTPDVVHITTPPDTHVELAQQAVDAGSHVLVEKPLALNSRDARALVEYVERRNRKLTVGYTYHFDPAMQTLRSRIARGDLGDVVHVESFFGYDLSGPYGRAIIQDSEHWVRRLPGGLLHNVIDHLLNKVTEFIPDQDPHVYVVAWVKSCSIGLPDELRLMIRGRNTSAFATFSANSRPLVHRLSVFGTKNIAHVDFVGSVLTFEPSPTLPGAFGRISCAFDQAKQYLLQGMNNVVLFGRSKYQPLPGLQLLISAFYDSIAFDGPLPITYADILKVCKLTDGVFSELYGPEVYSA